MNTQPPEHLPTKQLLLILLFAVLFVGPGIYMVEGHVGLGRWVVDFQDHWFGMHSMKGSLAVVLLAEGFCIFIPLMIVGLGVRLITGRSLVELLRKKK
jgi:hypothetical protein